MKRCTVFWVVAVVVAWAGLSAMPARSQPGSGGIHFDHQGLTRSGAILHDGPAAAGATRTLWDGRAADRRLVPPGLYFLHLQTATRAVSQRLMVTR